MSQSKTQPTNDSVLDFILKIEDEQKRKDALELLAINEELTGEKGVLWGESLIGFGSYHYKYESGREGDFFISGFSPRKTALSIYIMSGFSRYQSLLNQLGKHKVGKACLYVKKLNDIDKTILKELIQCSVQYMQEKYKD